MLDLETKVCWTQTKFPKRSSRSIFLAGPSPRKLSTPSWRPEAIETLRALGWDGWILSPEPFNNRQKDFDYAKQIEWEQEGLELADAILFWVPRLLPDMPAFTTNVEFGMWCNSGKIVLGAPDYAEKMSYLFYYAKKLGIPNFNNLHDTAYAAIKLASK